MTATNPLLTAWETPFALPPFAAIAPEHFLPAYERGFQEHEAEIAAIVANPSPPSFENTIDALELAGETLNRIGGVFWNLTATDSTDALREIEREISPRLARHYTAISLNAALFARVAALYDRRADLTLDEEQARLLELTYKSFLRTGARLEGADRDNFASIAEELAALEMNFAQNVLADESDYLLELDEADLSGLSEEARAAAAQAALDGKTSKNFALNLSRSTVEGFLSYAERRDLREEILTAFLARGEHEGSHDNRPVMAKILDLRRQRAQLLGYANFAAYKLEPTMAATPKVALDLLKSVWEAGKARAARECAELQQFADEEGANFQIAPQDWRYYAEKLRLRQYDLDQTALAPYFQLENMIEAAFYCAERLFGLRFIRRDDLTAYHPDVRAFEVLNRAGDHVALFFGDYFARPGKRSGAWMSNFRGQRKLGGEQRPIIINVMNFPKPPAGRAVLLTPTEVITLFHEFGHALHGMLSNVVYPSMSGTSTPTDFVELPSQLYEHWALHPEILAKFALHHESSEPIPVALINKLTAARHFNAGFATVEFCASALVDFELHDREEAPKDVVAAEAEILRALGKPAEIEMRHRTPHFTHIFSGESYAAGYYSYLWSEALDADAFAAFEETGDIFDSATAQKLHDHIYSAGNRRDPNEAWRLFRGRAPEFGALMRKKGLA